MIVAGTTATFGYIIDWALRASRDGAELIEVNPEETPLSRFATQQVREPAAIALPRIVDELSQLEVRCSRQACRLRFHSKQPTRLPLQLVATGDNCVTLRLIQRR